MDLADILTDDRASAALLQSSLPGFRDQHWQIRACAVAQSRRRISRRVREEGAPWLGVVWRIEAEDAARNESGTLWLYAKAYSRGASEAAWHAATAAACASPRFGTPIEHVAQFDLVVWALPNDPELTQLPAFLDSQALARHLPHGLVGEGEENAIRAEVVRHEPEEHCTARFCSSGVLEAQSFYGKCYVGDASWRDARDCLDALWRQSEADPAAFLIGRPLGASPALKAVWQAEVVGTPLALRLAGAESEATVQALVTALLRLQAGGPIQGRPTLPAEGLETARKWRKKLVMAEPELAPAIDAVLARLAHAPQFEATMVPVHGDFHVDQMLWSEGRIALFDYDNFTVGPACRDLADFISQLLCRDEPAVDWAGIAHRLLENYRASAPAHFDETAFEWQLRLMLLRKAYSFFVRSRSGWQARAEHSLRLARAGSACLEPGFVKLAA